MSHTAACRRTRCGVQTHPPPHVCTHTHIHTHKQTYIHTQTRTQIQNATHAPANPAATQALATARKAAEKKLRLAREDLTAWEFTPDRFVYEQWSASVTDAAILSAICCARHTHPLSRSLSVRVFAGCTVRVCVCARACCYVDTSSRLFTHVHVAADVTHPAPRSCTPIPRPFSDQGAALVARCKQLLEVNLGLGNEVQHGTGMLPPHLAHFVLH